jgi:SprT protein
MNPGEYKSILVKYLPERSVDPVYDLIAKHKVHLRITRKRKTKSGDFRPSAKGNPHKITVNHNLNPYAFLITFLHELAHQITWNKYANKVMPHGIEWKNTFAELLKPFVDDGVFPDDVAVHLKKKGHELLYSTSADVELSRVLKRYDKDEGKVTLESLPEKALFMFPDGSKFRKMEKRRKNYLCLNMRNERYYVVQPIAEVIPLDDK